MGSSHLKILQSTTAVLFLATATSSTWIVVINIPLWQIAQLKKLLNLVTLLGTNDNSCFLPPLLYENDQYERLSILG